MRKNRGLATVRADEMVSNCGHAALYSAYLVVYNTDAGDSSQNTSQLDLEIRNYLLERQLKLDTES